MYGLLHIHVVVLETLRPPMPEGLPAHAPNGKPQSVTMDR